jgi:hypothetical protein
MGRLPALKFLDKSMERSEDCRGGTVKAALRLMSLRSVPIASLEVTCKIVKGLYNRRSVNNPCIIHLSASTMHPRWGVARQTRYLRQTRWKVNGQI